METPDETSNARAERGDSEEKPTRSGSVRRVVYLGLTEQPDSDAYDGYEDYDFEPRPGFELRSTLEMQSKPELINELLASGALAASVTGMSAVAKAKIEATTQRLKNQQDTDTERERIQSQERSAALQAREQTKQARFQAQNLSAPPASE